MSKQTIIDKTNTIDILFADIWLIVCQLRQGVEISEGHIFYQHICQHIENIRQQLLENKYSKFAIESMLYAICALIDESVMNRLPHDEGYLYWFQSPLQAKYFNTLDAGNKLWDKLQDLLKRPIENQDILICFHRVIALGFIGKYYQNNTPEREKIIVLLNKEYPFHEKSNKLTLKNKPKYRFNQRCFYYFYWVIGLLLIIIIWYLLSNSLNNSFKQWIIQ